jgi:hypothetical protein
MKLIALLSLLAAGSASAAITMAGDLMFTGFNADGNDNLAFVLLADYTANTNIYFTDNEWDGSAFNTGESFFHWSNPVNLTAGTVVSLNNLSGGTLGASTGTVVFDDATNTGVAAGNESIYAYIGTSYDTATPTFLSAIANEGFVNAGTGVLTNTGLTAGTNAIAFTGGVDIAAYNGARDTQTTWADYRSLLANTANWGSQNASGDQSSDSIFPDVPFNTTSFSLVPEPGAALFLGLAGVGLIARRRRHV